MKTGNIVKGRITVIKSYGAFVKIDEKYDGLIHISEISDGFVKNIEDYISVGDVLDLYVLNVIENNKYNLSLKHIHKKSPKKRIEIKLTQGFEPFEEALPKWINDYKLK